MSSCPLSCLISTCSSANRDPKSDFFAPTVALPEDEVRVCLLVGTWSKRVWLCLSALHPAPALSLLPHLYWPASVCAGK